MNELSKLDSNILSLDDVSLHGNITYENKVNKMILLASINFVLPTKRRPTDVTLSLNICLLAISLSFYLCTFYALRFYILCLIT